MLFCRKGVEWLRATGAWADVLNYCLEQNPIKEVLKESYNFLYKLLESGISYDQTFCKCVIKQITQPLMVYKIYILVPTGNILYN